MDQAKKKAPLISSATRGKILQWLRTTHIWLGLWGAAIGLAFGLTGFLLNHRAIMKIPVERAEVSHTQAKVEQPLASPEELGKWLANYAGLPDAKPMIRQERGSTVSWRGRPTQQAERWNVMINTPKASVSAKYVPGGNVVELENQDATLLGLLIRLHTGVGASAFWILLADSIAVALMTLTLTGALLWSKLRAPRLIGMSVLLAAPVITAIYVTVG